VYFSIQSIVNPHRAAQNDSMIAASERQQMVVWERPEPPVRRAPRALSRESIVRAAIAIADADGLAAVSLRKVGAALDAGPMRLYGYLSTKEELLELMVDAVYGEMMAAERGAAGDWRDALRAIARHTRHAALRHPWFAELLGGRPHQGPNALAHLEASLAALEGTPGWNDIDVVLQAVKTVNSYVVGVLRAEAAERRAERDSGMTKAEWQAASSPYLFRMIATGRFPTLERVVRDATHPPAEIAFEQGLECVLDGVAARVAGTAPKE
jgi:AcrR family transcriptional regulator